MIVLLYIQISKEKYRKKIREGQVQLAFTRPLANTVVSLPNIDQLLERKIAECLLKQIISPSTTTNQPVSLMIGLFHDGRLLLSY